MPTYSTLRGSETWIPYAHPALSDSRSSVASDATAPNLPGPGRIIGLLLYGLGARFEAFLNRRAAHLRLGPEAVAQKIRCLRRHNETSMFDRLASPKSKQERKALRKLCKKLVNYASVQVLSTQLVALDEIVALTVEDPIIRMMMREFDLDRFAPEYREPDLIVSASKALGSLENTKIHDIWTTLISSGGESLNLSHSDYLGLQNLDVHFPPSRFLQTVQSLVPIMRTLWDETSYLGARYLVTLGNSNAYRKTLNNMVDTVVGTLARVLWLTYIETALHAPHVIEWENMDKCLQTSLALDKFADAKSRFIWLTWDFMDRNPNHKTSQSKQFEQYTGII